MTGQNRTDEIFVIQEDDEAKHFDVEYVGGEEMGKRICAVYGFDPGLIAKASIELVPGELATVVITMLLTRDALASLNVEVAD